MSGGQALGLLTQLLWNAALIAAPVLITALVVGLIVSVVQVITQLQEATLSYVPKVVAAGIVIVACAPWMIARLTAFSTSLYRLIPGMG